MQVYARLYHKAWETRVAAGEALGLLAEAFPHTTVADLAEQCTVYGGEAGAASVTVSNVVTFEEFNLKHILERGQALLASGGQVGGKLGGGGLGGTEGNGGWGTGGTVERGQTLLASGGQVGGGLRRKLSRQGHSPV